MLLLVYNNNKFNFIIVGLNRYHTCLLVLYNLVRNTNAQFAVPVMLCQACLLSTGDSKTEDFTFTTRPLYTGDPEADERDVMSMPSRGTINKGTFYR